MQNETTETTTSADSRLAAMPFHPPVGENASIDACPFGPMIKGLNVDPNLIFSVLSQYFGSAEFGDEEIEVEANP